MKKIPVYIISGFLGSGKTTAIIELLKQKSNDEQWAVIINEFGKISIDGQTFKSKSAKGSVFEISGGCICCSAKGYLNENLNTIIQTGNYSRIIIEPSGLGGIDMVSEIVEINPVLCLMPVVCIVDILGIENPRLQLNLIYRSQIAKAAILVFSKCDLLTDVSHQNRLIDKFIFTFPEKQNSIIPSETLFSELMNMDSQINAEETKYRMLFNSSKDLADSNYQELNFQAGADKIFDTENLTQFFKDHPSIIRAKGFIQTISGWKLFNYTLSGFIYEPCLPKSKSEMVVIAEKSDPHVIQSMEAELEKSCLLNQF